MFVIPNLVGASIGAASLLVDMLPVPTKEIRGLLKVFIMSFGYDPYLDNFVRTSIFFSLSLVSLIVGIICSFEIYGFSFIFCPDLSSTYLEGGNR